GGRPRNPGVHNVRGTSRSGRRTPDRGSPPAPAHQSRRAVLRQASPRRRGAAHAPRPRRARRVAALSAYGPKLHVMRRSFPSAAIPVHRRSIPQLAVDGALVALAYYTAFQLRFDNGPTGHYAALRSRTIWWVLAGSLIVLVFSGVYQRRWRYSG